MTRIAISISITRLGTIAESLLRLAHLDVLGYNSLLELRVCITSRR
jgi:hypothetical protein